MKTAKKQFLASVVSLLLCVSMLVGTTFAWFTDSVASNNNVIKSGNLDVVLEYWDGDSFEPVEEDTALIDNNAKWEPGFAQVVYLRIANEGSLALKYQLSADILGTEQSGINAAGESFKLSDYIRFGVKETATSEFYSNDKAGRDAAVADVDANAKLISSADKATGELLAGAETFVTYVVYMPASVGNKANHNGTDVPEIKLGVTVVATQLDNENDDFGTDYDADLDPATAYVTSALELYDALASGKDTTLMGNIDLNGVSFQRSGLATWKAIPVFSGTLNGNGYKITGIVSSTGLFDKIDGGSVKNLTIEATITGGSGEADKSVGILANTVVGNVTIDGVTVSGSVESTEASVGGLIGAIEAGDDADAVVTIVNCVNEATIKTEDSAQNVGGLVGSVNANVNVSESVNSGSVNDNEQSDNLYGDVSDEVDVEVLLPVYNQDELIAALENGYDVAFGCDIKIDPASMSNAYGATGINVKNGQTINGKGYTLNIAGAGGTWDSGINTTGGVIKNLTVTGSFRGIFVNHNSTHSETVVLENVTTTGTVYTVSCDQGKNQNLVATDCTFLGWTSYATTLGTAEFNGCYFGEGSGYAYMRPYAPTTYVGCTFEEGFAIDPVAVITLEGCYYGETLITADNIVSLGLVSESSMSKVTVK